MANKAGVQFSLGSLLIFVTLTAIVVKLTVLSPLIGVPAALLLLPSFVFSALIFERRRTADGPLSTKQKADVYADAMLASIVITVLCIVVFIAVASLVFWIKVILGMQLRGPWDGIAESIFGLLAAGLTAGFSVWYSWRKANK
jgi:hypothetical protein